MARSSNTIKYQINNSNKNVPNDMVKPKQEPSNCFGVENNGMDDVCELEHRRKLFIGGLAPYTTEESLREVYQRWGTVEDVVVMRDSVTRRSRGFGFVTYTKSSMVDCAQEDRPHVVDGKTVEAKRALPRPDREVRDANVAVKKLFVGGLKESHDKECILQYFTQFGKVVSVKILLDKITGKRRGFAFVEFDDYSAVDKATLQRSHTIKYVMVDVKKAIYSQDKRNRNSHNNYQHVQRPAATAPLSAALGHASGLALNPYSALAMNSAPMLRNYNIWSQDGQPNPLAPYLGLFPQSPIQTPMNNWNYPAVSAINWNAAAPPLVAPQSSAVNWQPQAQWGAAQFGASGAVAANPNWRADTPNGSPTGPMAPSTVPDALCTAIAQQPAPAPTSPVTFGTGYQQSYSGGPTKKYNMSANRLAPYGPAPHAGYGNILKKKLASSEAVIAKCLALSANNANRLPSLIDFNAFNAGQASGSAAVDANNPLANIGNMGPQVPSPDDANRRF